MDLNETKWKRTLPEWMKSPSKSSPSKSTDRGNRSVVQKSERPSYPPISIKKTKQLPRPVAGSLSCAKASSDKNAGPLSDKNVGRLSDKNAGPSPDKKMRKGDKLETSSSSFCNENPPEDYHVALDDFFLTVDDLTRVAQEVINEEHQKHAYMQARSARRQLLRENSPKLN